MKRAIFLAIFSQFLAAYTLDFPGDTPPLDSNPNWSDPTEPNNLKPEPKIIFSNEKTPSIFGEKPQKKEVKKDLDYERLKRLKEALDILFGEEEIQQKSAEKPQEYEIRYEDEDEAPVQSKFDIKIDGEDYSGDEGGDKITIELN